jgi:hypothetical protein
MNRTMVVAVLAALALVQGCGDSDADAPEDAGMDSGKETTPPPMRDASVNTGPEEFMCGQTMCTVPELNIESLDIPPIMGIEITPETIANMGYGPMGCCVGDNEDVCGVTQNQLFGTGFCAEQDQEGRPDEGCPSESADLLGLLTIDLKGCCRFNNTCGVDLGIIGVGCVEREEAAMIEIMGMALPDAGAIEAIDCTYDNSAMDGGVDDAGSD